MTQLKHHIEQNYNLTKCITIDKEVDSTKDQNNTNDSINNILTPLNFNGINLNYDSEKENYENVLDKLKKVKKRFQLLSQYR